jgi:hypothetical protein
LPFCGGAFFFFIFFDNNQNFVFFCHFEAVSCYCFDSLKSIKLLDFGFERVIEVFLLVMNFLKSAELGFEVKYFLTFKYKLLETMKCLLTGLSLQKIIRSFFVFAYFIFF